MLVIRKKRILFLVLTILLSITYFSFLQTDPNFKAYSNIETQAVSSTPVTNHTVVLDAGHGLPDGGAVSKSGISEEKINLNIIKKLQELLEASNCTVILTRSDENGIYEANAKSKKASDLKNRIDIINNLEAEILVSVHLNKISQEKYSGWQTFYKKDDENSQNLANLIQNNLNYSIQKENKRKIVSTSQIYLLKNSNIPSVLVECGFLSNPHEALLLKDDEYQNSLAWGIYTGIMDYFK